MFLFLTMGLESRLHVISGRQYRQAPANLLGDGIFCAISICTNYSGSAGARRIWPGWRRTTKASKPITGLAVLLAA